MRRPLSMLSSRWIRRLTRLCRVIPMRFQRGNIWLKSGREKSPLPPFEKGGLGGILRLGPSPVHCTALNATWYQSSPVRSQFRSGTAYYEVFWRGSGGTFSTEKRSPRITLNKIPVSARFCGDHDGAVVEVTVVSGFAVGCIVVLYCDRGKSQFGEKLGDPFGTVESHAIGLISDQALCF